MRKKKKNHKKEVARIAKILRERLEEDIVSKISIKDAFMEFLAKGEGRVYLKITAPEPKPTSDKVEE
jgi:Zn/Cd-binding protein ZinT